MHKARQSSGFNQSTMLQEILKKKKKKREGTLIRAFKKSLSWDGKYKYSRLFYLQEARQQLEVPLFLPRERAPLTQSHSKMGCWNIVHKTWKTLFCLSIFSSPDNKYNIALSINYDLRMLRKTRTQGFWLSSWPSTCILMHYVVTHLFKRDFHNFLKYNVDNMPLLSCISEQQPELFSADKGGTV